MNRVRANRDIQCLLVRQLIRHDFHKEPELLIRRAELAARYAYGMPAGNLANASLENCLLRWGRQIAAQRPKARPRESVSTRIGDARRSVLHVATAVNEIGGHSRVIASWVRLDPGSRHVLALTNHGGAIPEWLQTAVRDSGGAVVDLTCEGESRQRVRDLASLASSGFDVVVLHHHPYDVIPALAFANGSPPVAVFNHADHVFWVGAGICDLFVEFRSQGEHASISSRFARTSIHLPMPIADELLRVPSRDTARGRLGIASSTPVFVSMGSEYKYQPTLRQNFFRSCGRLLERLPSARVYVVGVPPDTRLVSASTSHERLHFVGTVADPGDYVAAADVYLDGFPLGAGVGLLEFCLAGVVPVLAHSVQSEFFTFRDGCLEGLIRSPSDEEEWLETAVELVRCPERRKGLAGELSDRVRRRHSSWEWGDSVRQVYEMAEAAGHNPVILPEGLGGVTNVDAARIDSSRFRLWSGSEVQDILLDQASAFTPSEWCELFVMALRLGELHVDADFLRRISAKALRITRRLGMRLRDR